MKGVGEILFCKGAHDFNPAGSVISEWHIFFLWSISHFLAALLEVTRMFSSLHFFWFVFGCLWCPESELHIWHILWSNIKACHILDGKIQGDWRTDSPPALREAAKVGSSMLDLIPSSPWWSWLDASLRELLAASEAASLSEASLHPYLRCFHLYLILQQSPHSHLMSQN